MNKKKCNYLHSKLETLPLDELLKKSEEELLRKPKEKCIDYLYEVVKNHPYKPYYDPDVIY